MKKKRRFFTKDELITIWDRTKNGDSFQLIATDLNDANPLSVQQAHKYLAEFITGIRVFNAWTPLTYREAVKVLLEREAPTNVLQPEQVDETPESDNLSRLETAFANFQDAIAQVIVSEVKKRSSEAVAGKEEELAKQKEYYETELQKMQTILVAAKDSSIVGHIKRAWERQ